MSRAVMISIQPQWCEKIAKGEKTIEVRKSHPKLEAPFKCYIYCTLPPNRELFTHGCIREYANELIRLQSGEVVYGYGMQLCCDPENRPYTKDNFLCKKVIGEFVCDYIDEIRVFENGTVQDWNLNRLEKSCLSYDNMVAYIGAGKRGYGWHISDLVIYDKPKELGEFCHTEGADCRRVSGRTWFKASDMDASLKRPPQSWCYVEKVQGSD